MAGFISLFSFQSRIKFRCNLIDKRSETRHMLIAPTIIKQYITQLFGNFVFGAVLNLKL